LGLPATCEFTNITNTQKTATIALGIDNHNLALILFDINNTLENIELIVNAVNLPVEKINTKKLTNGQKCFIAQREDLPMSLVEKLANNKDKSIKDIIAQRKDLPMSLIEKLANNKDEGIRYIIAKRQDLPMRLIEKLANDKKAVVRFEIAERKDLPISILKKLANDAEPGIRGIIAPKIAKLPP
jgi:hypothetical protein